MKGISVANRGQQTHLSGLIEVGAVDEKPGGGHIRQPASTLHHTGQETMELCGIVAEGLSGPTSKLAKEVAQGSAHLPPHPNSAGGSNP